MLEDFIRRHNAFLWIVSLAAQQSCPKEINFLCDWLPQYWLAMQEYCHQYPGDILDIRWECVLQRALERTYRLMLRRPLCFLEGLK